MSSFLNFEHGERWFRKEIKRDSARIYQLEIERRMRFNKAPKEELKSQPRKVRFEDEWDPGVTNRRHDGVVRESRVREKQNSNLFKKKNSFGDSEAYRKLEKEFAQQLQDYLEFELSRSSNTSSCQQGQSQEEGSKLKANSQPPMENEPETDKMEEIEVTAEEGELWFESVSPSLPENEDEVT